MPPRPCRVLIFDKQTRRTRQCGKQSAKGLDVCKDHHKRSSDKGTPITHGKWSMWMPPRLLETYETLLQSADPFNLLHQYTFLHCLAIDKLSRMGDTTPTQLWWKVRNKLKKIIATEERKGPVDEDLHDSLSWCMDTLETIGDMQRNEQDVRQLIREMGEVIKVETARAEKQRAYLTPEQAMAFVAGLTTIILDGIEKVNTDEDNWRERFRESIARDFIRICTTTGVQKTNALENKQPDQLPV